MYVLTENKCMIKYNNWEKNREKDKEKNRYMIIMTLKWTYLLLL